jgi:hypothetical protein
MSYDKMRKMAFHGKYQIRSKKMLISKTIGQIQYFNYLGCDISFNCEHDLRQNMYRFQYVCGTMKRTLRNKTRKDTMLVYYEGIVVPVLMCGLE